ncbi:retropepsin-like aspartic protease [Winogradskyella alexanderae]|uniref:Retroviral-like aspartic protease family protein n=1 Tax=Winogradskyella alexanderae TaxID=2877123 RepID=A0ABS7XM01_9FLAO|nr:retropepsin-like aspartic protease [Winogradskyella alexanderae]MCA0131023.1 retroviral-like aspartic protease family protein [Winogradskyella alexanderae]
MESLQDFLLNKGYSKIKLKFTKTNHFEIRAYINGVKGRFILDTGASSSCVGFEAVDRFKLKVKDSEIRAVGAGASNLETKISKSNNLKIGRWKRSRVVLILFNLSHVNNGLINHNAEPVDGIIGADILKKGKAVIDYQKKYLYLKMKDVSLQNHA